MTTRIILLLTLVLTAATMPVEPLFAHDGERSEATTSTPAWCHARGWGAPRAVPKRLERVAERARTTRDPDFVVRRARATQLGVIALVTGDVAKARRELRGVRHVRSWTGLPQGDFPPGWRIGAVIQELLEPTLQWVLRRQRGIPGGAGPGFWDGSGAIVLEWKAPVPPAIRRLAGVRPDGAEVRVVPRPYSTRDLTRAGDRLLAFLDERDVQWSGLGDCRSSAGLELMVPYAPHLIGVSQAELEAAAGVRVTVVAGSVMPA